MSEVSRRQFSKSALAALGGGAIALLFGGASGGLGLETDPLAVLTTVPFVGGFDSPQTIIGQKGNTLTLTTVDALQAGGSSFVIRRDNLTLMEIEIGAAIDDLKIGFAFDSSDATGINIGSFLNYADFNPAGPNSASSNMFALNIKQLPYPTLPALGVIIGDDGSGAALGIPASFASPWVGIFTDPVNGMIKLLSPSLDFNTAPVPVVNPGASGATVGPPTAGFGSAGGLNRSDHRHAFSGRFTYSGIEFNALLPGGVFPDKFSRLKINTNWTLRRIWAFTKNGPTGGTETYGIVNAAGALQGTAVVIPASAGAVSEAESALQTTNLTGGTLYYLAQTASAAVVASTNVEVGIEYTMNA